MRQMASQPPQRVSRRDKDRLFQFLLLANFLEYLEAGAVPALLLQLSTSYHMSPGQQGLLGGVVYLSLSIGGPFAGNDTLPLQLTQRSNDLIDCNIFCRISPASSGSQNGDWNCCCSKQLLHFTVGNDSCRHDLFYSRLHRFKIYNGTYTVCYMCFLAIVDKSIRTERQKDVMDGIFTGMTCRRR